MTEPRKLTNADLHALERTGNTLIISLLTLAFLVVCIALFMTRAQICHTPTEDSPIENHCEYKNGRWVNK